MPMLLYGCCGDDDNGRFLLSSLGKTPLHLSKFRVNKGSSTASTTVLSDPEYDNGNGERIFINTIGASWQYHADELDDDFIASDIVLFGGTALVPDIHSHLDSLLAKSKHNGCFTVVSTVFDFRSEKEHPDCPWTLGANNDSYTSVDLI
jgi:sugar/nucleoside kinase (ribokinase family)